MGNAAMIEEMRRTAIADVEGAGGFEEDTRDRIQEALADATPDELAILNSLHALGPAHLADFFSGAHTILSDGGSHYEEWKELPGARERVSSHKSKGPQYQIAGKATGPILFGLTEDGGSTWFQMEGHRGDLSLDALPDLIPHMIDFFKYKLSGKNQGRYGESEYTDSKPLRL